MPSFTEIISAPIANVLILAGLVFLAVAVVGKISGRIEPGRSGRVAAGVFGAIFVAIGLFFYLTQDGNGSQSIDTPESPEPTEDVSLTAIEPSPTPESATPTSAPEDTPEPTPAPDANLLLVYDDKAVHAINVSDVPLSLVGVTFRPRFADGDLGAEFAASIWLNRSARADPIDPGNCLQALKPPDDIQRHRDCNSLQVKELIFDQNLRFWEGVANSSEFKVFLDDEEIHTCKIQEGECKLYLPEP